MAVARTRHDCLAVSAAEDSDTGLKGSHGAARRSRGPVCPQRSLQQADTGRPIRSRTSCPSQCSAAAGREPLRSIHFSHYAPSHPLIDHSRHLSPPPLSTYSLCSHVRLLCPAWPPVLRSLLSVGCSDLCARPFDRRGGGQQGVWRPVLQCGLPFSDDSQHAARAQPHRDARHQVHFHCGQSQHPPLLHRHVGAGRGRGLSVRRHSERIVRLDAVHFRRRSASVLPVREPPQHGQ